MTRDSVDDGLMLVLGEVHTGLLQSSSALSLASVARLLTLMGGERVHRYERPIAHVVSPALLTGVDCRLATSSGAKVRGVGTVVSRASITGGHALQGSAVVHVVHGETERRSPWSYHLARPGRVEIIGKANQKDLADGFAMSRPPAAALNLGAVSGRIVDHVQSSPALDRRAPFRAARTRLRWVAVISNSDPIEAPRFSIENGSLRTYVVTCDKDRAYAVAAFCEDLALHDWLLTTTLHLIQRSRMGIDARSEVVNRLRPAVDHLLHLWMPAARLDQNASTLWEGLERRPGLNRQWQAAVNRIRDQIALSSISLMGNQLEQSGK